LKKPETSGSSLFSPLSIILAVVAMFVLFPTLIIKGPSIFSPGQLSSQSTRGMVFAGVSSHAVIETQCKLCHQPLVFSQSESCLNCHDDISIQVNQEIGMHGSLAINTSCRNCHSDHQGREFDMLAGALKNFDHNQTSFPLTGEHVSLTCKECHTENNFQIGSDCSTCHAEPEQHAGMFSQDCSVCHSTQVWVPAIWEGNPFDHGTVGFSLILHKLDYQGNLIACMDCHQSEAIEIVLPSCQECHEQNNPGFMQEHSDLFGFNCTDCHDGVDKMQNFDHQNFFILDGAHGALECLVCHENQQFRETPTECSVCHEEPDIHAGSFGLNCANCHSTEAWQPAMLMSHTFPLDHGEEGEIECMVCHVDSYTQYTCESCHDSQEREFIEEHEDENIPREQLMDCVACHEDGEAHD